MLIAYIVIGIVAGPAVLGVVTAQDQIDLLAQVDADLLVVGKHGSHMADKLLLGSVTKHVLAESQCDVLVIGDPREATDESP
ncbi:MAG: Universal stress protein family protein [Candidatus Accumulibacter vicinus]|uniref:Universal stress protein family protein n=1 Tax=Candidatus Accumulibacter vicinus TaxID=2954382 RepID=A0A084Y5G9_9PROT|nr:MAG: Universal stress protein family protein [Candidatus Accumulibacter vicinus]